MRPSSICVLVSGGLDSDVLAAEYASQGSTVWPIYIRQGLAWESVELYWLRKFLRAVASPTMKPLQILSLPITDVYGSHWSTGQHPVPGARTPDSAVFLPGRNLLLTVKAAIFCAMKNIPALALAPLDQNPFPDATPSFFKGWQKIVSQGLGKDIQILTPYRRLEKSEVISRGRTFPLGLTFSCLAPREKQHCGRCNKCAERKKAFREAGVVDKTSYDQPHPAFGHPLPVGEGTRSRG